MRTSRLLPLALATFAVGTDNFVIAGLLPAIAADLHTSVSAAGQLVTLFALTFAVSAALVGAALSGLDRRTAMLIALVVFTVGNVLTAVGPAYGWVLAARILTAVGAGTITSSASALAAATAPEERRGWAMSVVLGGLSVATVLGLPLGILVGSGRWRLTLCLVAGVGLVATLGVAALVPSVRLPAARLRQRLAPLRQPWIVAVLVSTMLIFGSTYTVYTYVAPVLAPVTGGAPRVLAVLLLVFGLGNVVGTLFSGRLADRFSAERVLIGVLALTLVVLAVAPVAVRLLHSVSLWILVWGICIAAPTVPQQHRLTRDHPAAMPVLLGLNSSAIYLGISLGGAAGGLALHWLPPRGLVLPAAGFTLCAAGLVVATTLLSRPRVPQPRPGSPDATGRPPVPMSSPAYRGLEEPRREPGGMRPDLPGRQGTPSV